MVEVLIGDVFVRVLSIWYDRLLCIPYVIVILFLFSDSSSNLDEDLTYNHIWL